jgi:hypothetical protein
MALKIIYSVLFTILLEIYKIKSYQSAIGSGPKTMELFHQTRIVNSEYLINFKKYETNISWVKLCPLPTSDLLHTSTFNEFGHTIILLTTILVQKHQKKNKKLLKLKILQSGINILNPGPNCQICNLQGKRNQLTKQCNKCKNWFHRTCLQIPSYLFNTKIHPDQNWECISCKTSSSSNSQLICNICMKYYKRWILQQCERCNDNFHRACIEKIIGKSKAKK